MNSWALDLITKKIEKLKKEREEIDPHCES
jgi:hypothetical protein